MNFSQGRVVRFAGVGTVTGLVVAYATALLAVVAIALAWDFGASVGNARESVAVAMLPIPVAPVARAVLAADGGDGGTLEGVITFSGDVPQARLLVKKGDPSVQNAATCAAQDVPAEGLVINKDNRGLANVFVYLRTTPAGAKVPPPPDEPFVIDQKHCQFLPHAMVVRVGVPVLARNDDDVMHNTHPEGDAGFNSAIPPNERKGVPFKYKATPRPLPSKVKCDVHTWMTAYHLPLEHPWGAVTDVNGKFTIQDLPPGKHEFTFWHEAKGYLSANQGKRVIEIKPGQKTEFKLSVSPKDLAAFSGPRPDTVAIAP